MKKAKCEVRIWPELTSISQETVSRDAQERDGSQRSEPVPKNCIPIMPYGPVG